MKQMADTVTTLATGSVLTALLFSLFVFFPRISMWEGEYFPVVTNTKLKILAEDKSGVYVNAKFDKVRNCEFLSLNWYKFSPDGALVRIPVEFLDDDAGPSISRPLGKHEGARWKIGISAAGLPATMAEAKHRCHPLWKTTTQFWPDPE